MKKLGLLRHAKSDWGPSDKRDFDRGLNARGKRGAALMGAHVREQGVAWDRLIASPARRVQLTLESAAIGPAPQWDERLYLASTDAIYQVLHEAGGDAVLIAGHNPGLGDMILDLVAPGAQRLDQALVLVEADRGHAEPGAPGEFADGEQVGRFHP